MLNKLMTSNPQTMYVKSISRAQKPSTYITMHLAYEPLRKIMAMHENGEYPSLRYPIVNSQPVSLQNRRHQGAWFHPPKKVTKLVV